MDTSTSSAPSSGRLPSWLAEALDVLSARRRLVGATAVGLVLLGALVALLLPSVLPAQPVVGAAVGIAAALLATALALAMDASDLVVRGTRHVHAAGGTVDVRVGRQPDDVGPLLAAVARHASDGQVRVALSPASRTAGVPGPRAAALAEALARTGRKVLLTDLTRGGTPAAGLSDVIAGSRSLAESVRFEQELYLARLAVGSDPDVAISGFADWAQGLPSDLEVLVAALPPLADRGVLAAAGAMDLTLVLVEVDRTERVDLIASLDAVDASGLASELVLVDPHRTVGGSEPGPAAAAAIEDDPSIDDDVVEEDTPGAQDDEGDQVTAEVDETVADEREVAAASADAPDSHLEPAEPPVVGPVDEPLETDDTDDDLFAEAEADEDERGATEQVHRVEPVEEDVLAQIGLADLDDQADTPDEAEDTPVEAEDAPVDADATAEIFLTHEPSPDELSAIWEAPAEPARAPEPEPPSQPAPAHEQAPTPEPARASEPEPAPQPAPASAQPRVPDDEGLDPAALEVARTSAALHQLAQQIWDREER